MDYKEVDPEFQDDTTHIPIKGYDSEQKNKKKKAFQMLKAVQEFK